MNSISFSLFGASPKYYVGMVENARLAKEIYPGWEVWVWHDQRVPKVTLKKIKSMGVRLRPGHDKIKNEMFWRFLIADVPGVERFIVRDCDSRLNQREAGAVKEWIESGLPMHTIRDHPGHSNPIMGGMWGGSASWFGGERSMEKLIVESRKADEAYAPERAYSKDQVFLANTFWYGHEADWCQHDFCYRDVYPAARAFPAKIGDWRFVGEIFDENNNPQPDHWQMRVNWMGV